ncbi:MAG: Adenylylsulfate kinase [Candidatus Nomurabacteria bacterium GW2011_GWA2_40_9]|uniref:Adenylylsulfate kinase n=1 Tax=Candidatus Nomurabacteria bacterium GW2011_GWA2_40_9 TaxID=1618734 RepID=A0A0G0TXF6_9BACT|nr:MAG: Adenylylsulfate kinase [Candidatus Nomurabacteria bacterium GW2011_GWA2_40_9]
MVLWLIGMSGAGKTVIGREVYVQLKKTYKNIIFFDGDTIRELMGNDLGYNISDRKKNANRICRLCHFFDAQGIHVICGILSIFHESQKWNKENIKDYYEVYLKTSLKILQMRDSKNLYRQSQKGETHHVVGMDIKFPEPLNPDLIVHNDGADSVEDIAQTIISKLIERKLI